MLFLISFFAVADIPSGNNIENAVTLDVPPSGFDAIIELVPAVLPPEIPVPSTSGSGGTWCINYAYVINNLWERRRRPPERILVNF